MYIDGKLARNDYEEAVSYNESKLSILTTEHNTIITDRTEFEKYVGFGVLMLPHFKNFYVSANFESKRKVIGSIFPEKLIFELGKYRTGRINALFELITSQDGLIKGRGKEKAGKTSGLSSVAPPSGLEPETP